MNKQVSMNTSLISKIIHNMDFAQDIDLVADVAEMLQPLQGEISEKQTTLYILASTAIVCESHCTSVSKAGQSGAGGITIEKLMHSVKQSEKESYLGILEQIMIKQEGCLLWLRAKLSQLKINYHVYKKYQDLFEIMGEKSSFSRSYLRILSSFFWIVYITTKEKGKTLENLVICPELHSTLLTKIFHNYLAILTEDEIKKILARKIKERTHVASKRSYEEYIEKTIQECYHRKYPDQKSFREVIVNEEDGRKIFESLIPEISEMYYNVKEECSVDQIEFLESNQVMSPRSYVKKTMSEGFKLVKKGYFLESNEKEKDRLLTSLPTPIKKSSFTTFQLPTKPPENGESSRLSRLSWVQTCIDSVQQIYKEYNRSLPYSAFKHKIQCYMKTVIQTYFPNCRKIQDRREKIETFYFYFLYEMVEMYESKHQEIIFRDHRPLVAILCLVCAVFSCCYRANKGKFRDYCQMFELSVLDAFKPINWFGRYIKVPDHVSDDVYQIQRRFLVQEIWEDQVGYSIITNCDDSIPKTEMAIFKRIQHHVYCRILEICREVKLNEGSANNIFKMVFSILSSHPPASKKLNMDQIILCSVIACLSINQKENEQALQKVMGYYDAISADYEKSAQLYDGENRISLITYYNTVFLKEIEEFMKKNPNSSSFYLSPSKSPLRKQNGTKKEQKTTALVSVPGEKFTEYQNHKLSPVNTYNFRPNRTHLINKLESLQEQSGEDSLHSRPSKRVKPDRQPQ